MAELRLPLWFVPERKPRTGVSSVPCDDRTAVLVFTHSEPLSALLFSGNSNQWKIDLVADRKELLAMISDLHEQGHNSLCVNPTADGRGGESVSLRELMTFSDSLVEVS